MIQSVYASADRSRNRNASRHPRFGNFNPADDSGNVGVDSSERRTRRVSPSRDNGFRETCLFGDSRPQISVPPEDTGVTFREDAKKLYRSFSDSETSSSWGEAGTYRRGGEQFLRARRVSRNFGCGGGLAGVGEKVNLSGCSLRGGRFQRSFGVGCSADTEIDGRVSPKSLTLFALAKESWPTVKYAFAQIGILDPYSLPPAEFVALLEGWLLDGKDEEQRENLSKLLDGSEDDRVLDEALAATYKEDGESDLQIAMRQEMRHASTVEQKAKIKIKYNQLARDAKAGK